MHRPPPEGTPLVCITFKKLKPKFLSFNRKLETSIMESFKKFSIKKRTCLSKISLKFKAKKFTTWIISAIIFVYFISPFFFIGSQNNLKNSIKVPNRKFVIHVHFLKLNVDRDIMFKKKI